MLTGPRTSSLATVRKTEAFQWRGGEQKPNHICSLRLQHPELSTSSVSEHMNLNSVSTSSQELLARSRPKLFLLLSVMEVAF